MTSPEGFQLGMRRALNEWRRVAPGLDLPFMVWDVGWGEDGQHDQETCRRLLDTMLERRLFEGVALSCGMVASVLAAKLQSAKSARVFEWLTDALASTADARCSYPFLDERLGELCGRYACQALPGLLRAASGRLGVDELWQRVDHTIAGAGKLLQQGCPTPTTLEVLLEAFKRGVPVKRFSSLPSYQLGTGWRQRHLWKTFTDRTSHLATILSTHKHLTISVLAQHGFPVPRQRAVGDANAALNAARWVGYPVVVKPTSSDFGTAVSVGISNEAELLEAFRQARAHGNVLVEEMIRGFDHRLHVIDGRCTSVIRRSAASVTGNGVDTVSRLVEAYTQLRAQDPLLRKHKPASLEDPMVIEMLRKQGVAPSTVPVEGATIFLRSNSNVSSGGSWREVTQQAHPDNVLLAERAAKCIGLDHAGVDFLTIDISRSWRDIGGAICEVNPTPGIVVAQTHPDILDYLFPGGGDGRIPIALVVAEPHEGQGVMKRFASCAEARSICAGAVVNMRAFVGPVEVTAGDRPLKALVEQLSSDRDVRCLCVQADPGELEAGGLDIGYCDLAVFLTGQDAAQRIIRSRHSVAGLARRILVQPSLQDLQREFEELLTNA